MRPKAARSYILTTNKAQPVDALLVAETNALRRAVHFAPRNDHRLCRPP